MSEYFVESTYKDASGRILPYFDFTKNGEPHITAVSQLIQCHIAVNEKESEIVPFFNGHKSGSMINYAESVLTKVQMWLEDHNYPSKIQGVNKKYHVQYE